MTPYYADSWLTVWQGDCREVLRDLAAESVNCVVTSPPYFGLRDYGTATWNGGLESCPHRIPATGSTQNKGNNNRQGAPFASVCGLCGAQRVDLQLGLEPTPELYVAHLVEVFREVRRVLRKDGTVWLNLGDSYASHDPGDRRDGQFLNPDGKQYDKGRRSGPAVRNRAGIYGPGMGLKPKDRIMIPARVALALQADGWWLRDEIVWHKPNPMPSSVTDRTTPAHEMVYLLTRSARYQYDAAAITEPALPSSLDRYNYADGDTTRINTGGRYREAWDVRDPYINLPTVPDSPLTRNKRSVWTVTTQPYPEAHFATFPEALVEPMVKAGCPENGVVLDPFAGSGTVGLVAQRLSRRAVLVDLNAEYLRQSLVRNSAIPLGLVSEAVG